VASFLRNHLKSLTAECPDDFTSSRGWMFWHGKRPLYRCGKNLASCLDLSIFVFKVEFNCFLKVLYDFFNCFSLLAMSSSRHQETYNFPSFRTTAENMYVSSIIIRLHRAIKCSLADAGLKFLIHKTIFTMIFYRKPETCRALKGGGPWLEKYISPEAHFSRIYQWPSLAGPILLSKPFFFRVCIFLSMKLILIPIFIGHFFFVDIRICLYQFENGFLGIILSLYFPF
jgi:hypothetical protein